MSIVQVISTAINVLKGIWFRVLINLVEFLLIIVKSTTQRMCLNVKNVRAVIH